MCSCIKLKTQFFFCQLSKGISFPHLMTHSGVALHGFNLHALPIVLEILILPSFVDLIPRKSIIVWEQTILNNWLGNTLIANVGGEAKAVAA